MAEEETETKEEEEIEPKKARTFGDPVAILG